MLCNVCREGLEGIWDSSKTKRVCTVDEWKDSAEPGPEVDSRFVSKTIIFEDIERPDAPERFVFGHHATRESFLQSIDQGCVFCNRFALLEKDAEPNPKISRLGYYSVFEVVRKPTAFMHMHVGNQRGGFDMIPHDCTNVPLRYSSSAELITLQLATCN